MKTQINTRTNKNRLNDQAIGMRTRVIVLILGLILSSCAHPYYLSKGPNVPLFTEKNEFSGSISMGMGDYYSSTEVQAAYALTDHIAVMSDFIITNGGYETNQNYDKLKYFDGAVGYFKPFDKFLVFEIFGGFGTCSQEHIYYSYNWLGSVTFPEGKANISYTKSFLQPSIGMTFKAFEVAFSTSLSSQTFNIESNSVSNTTAYNDEIRLISENNHVFLFEPALTCRAGWENVKFQFQYIYTANLTAPDLNLGKSKVNLGIFFTIAKKTKKASE